MGLLTLKSGETVNQGAARLAEEHRARSGRYAEEHFAIAFCQCEVARDYRACKADPRYLHKAGPLPWQSVEVPLPEPKVVRLRGLEESRRGAYESGSAPGIGDRTLLIAVNVSSEATIQDLAGMVEGKLQEEGIGVHEVGVWPSADAFAEDYSEGRLQDWVLEGADGFGPEEEEGEGKGGRG